MFNIALPDKNHTRELNFTAAVKHQMEICTPVRLLVKQFTRPTAACPEDYGNASHLHVFI